MSLTAIVYQLGFQSLQTYPMAECLLSAERLVQLVPKEVNWNSQSVIINNLILINFFLFKEWVDTDLRKIQKSLPQQMLALFSNIYYKCKGYVEIFLMFYNIAS